MADLEEKKAEMQERGPDVQQVLDDIPPDDSDSRCEKLPHSFIRVKLLFLSVQYTMWLPRENVGYSMFQECGAKSDLCKPSAETGQSAKGTVSHTETSINKFVRKAARVSSIGVLRFLMVGVKVEE